MQNIVLIGFMGCGKSAVGRALARARALAFIDTDDEIERRAGCPISRIFAEFGEPHFRRLESEVVAEAAGRDATVIATGGGAVLNPDNAAALKAGGRFVWLDVPVDVLWQRLRRSTNRPLLATADPYGELLRLHEKRRPLYAQLADVVVRTQGSVAEVAEQVWEALA